MPRPNQPSPDVTPRHPVRVVALRTGLSTHVLRAWERRYGAVTPTRTEGGQRLYSDADIDRLSLLSVLTRDGGSIAQLARLSLPQLQHQAEHRSTAGTAPAEGRLGTMEWRASALGAVEASDGSALRRVFDRAAAALGVERFLEQVLTPVMVEIGERWHVGRLTVGQEHLATAVVREVLGSLREVSQGGPNAPLLVVATPPGQIHEGGGLLVAAVAAGAGWRIVYLGVDLPSEEIIATAQRVRARAVALSLIHPPNDPGMSRHLRAFRKTTSLGVALLVGGGSASSYRTSIAAAGGMFVPDLAGLRAALTELELSRH